jgi:predicted short-subunit dehydrogenase-like oxidoreductase (DUF2520 family)
MKRVAVVGPGRVGTALALALPSPAYEVVAVAGRGRPGVDAFLTRFPAARALPAMGAARGADLVLVTVPDDELAGVVRRVAVEDGVAEGSRWVHTAGGYGHDVLRPARLAGAAVAACHPAQTFPDPDAGRAELPGTAWAVTADEADLGWARVLVTDLGGSPVTVRLEDRTLYHAGLAVGANGTSSVVTLARDLLLGAGVAEPGAFLGPLARAAAAGAADRGAQALTGPVRRGDAGTVDRHLAELGAVLPEAVEAYVALARLALSQARRAGLDPERADAVAERLD